MLPKNKNCNNYSTMKKNHSRILGIVFGLLGTAILSFVFLPIISYQIIARRDYPELLTPLAKSLVASKVASEQDFTKASNWFADGKNKSDFVLSGVTHYTISIPTLDIKNAVVSIGGEDLSESLVQYPGTALPGKDGNAVLFGHSILPIFFDPANYLSIFSTLPLIKIGDEIFIDFDGVQYTYAVEDKFEVRPTDIQILEQNDNSAYLTLVTCTPPGDPRKPKRLIVRAKIVPTNRPR